MGEQPKPYLKLDRMKPSKASQPERSYPQRIHIDDGMKIIFFLTAALVAALYGLLEVIF